MDSRLVGLLCLALVPSCSGLPTRDLGDLLVQDSTYVDPETMAPYTGQVVRRFDDDQLQLEATLREGAWEGELTIYHPTGRVHFQGEMSRGARCGGWIENDRPTAPESLYEEIKEDLESLVMYPPCPER